MNNCFKVIIGVLFLSFLLISCKEQKEFPIQSSTIPDGSFILSFIDEEGNDLLLPSTRFHFDQMMFYWYGGDSALEESRVRYDSPNEDEVYAKVHIANIYNWENEDTDYLHLYRYLQVRPGDIDTIYIDRTREANEDFRRYNLPLDTMEFFNNDSLYVQINGIPTVILKKD